MAPCSRCGKRTAGGSKRGGRKLRFLHVDVAPIIAFIESQQLRLFDCDVSAGRTVKLAESAALAAYNAESNLLWGTSPKHFFLATHEKVPPDLDLYDAVVRAEANEGEIALCAYVDGGIISITREVKEFQKTARDASWWQAGR